MLAVRGRVGGYFRVFLYMDIDHGTPDDNEVVRMVVEDTIDADGNSTKWVTSSDGSASSNKPTRGAIRNSRLGSAVLVGFWVWEGDRPRVVLRPPPRARSVPMRVVLLGFAGKSGVLDEAERLRPSLEKHAEIVDADFTGQKDLSEVQADLAIVFGGDGSILRAAHQMGRRQLPVIAVNLGKLGFLADVSPHELPEVLDDFASGKLNVIEHLMLVCRVLRGDEVRYQGDRKSTRLNSSHIPLSRMPSSA